MTENNIVATLAAVCGVLVALFNYLKSRRIEKGVSSVYGTTNGRYEMLIAENRRLRESLAAQTGAENAVQIVNDVLDERDGKHHARDS